MASVSVENLSKEFSVGSGVEVAVDDVTFTAEQGEFVTIVGPSGCGKTTLLRCIAGLENPTKGRILFGTKDVTDVIPQRRGVAMVFQDIAVYSHMTAAENILYPLKIQHVPEDERERRLREATEMLQIDQYLDKSPSELSGGQRQRVALARSLVQQPNLFLFDEPTSNLDAKLKVEIRKEIQKVSNETDQTMIYVTHDQEEAMTMSDKIVVMDEGDIMQIGEPQDVYNRPNNEFVASFIGTPSMNILEGEKRGDELSIDGMGTLKLDAGDAIPSTQLSVGFRPEAVEISSPDDGDFVGTVEVVESTGTNRVVYLDTPQGEIRVLTEKPLSSIVEGESRGLVVDTSRLLFFDASNGERITWREDDQSVPVEG